jgi:hypothetical protein
MSVMLATCTVPHAIFHKFKVPKLGRGVHVAGVNLSLKGTGVHSK